MPLLLGVAAAVGLSLAVVFTPAPQSQTPEQTPYSWENIQAMFSSKNSITAQNEGSTSQAGESSIDASLDTTLTLR